MKKKRKSDYRLMRATLDYRIGWVGLSWIELDWVGLGLVMPKENRKGIQKSSSLHFQLLAMLGACRRSTSRGKGLLFGKDYRGQILSP